ncbi:hypothetical protein Sste5344_008021 [Sporothrix stenoceras]
MQVCVRTPRAERVTTSCSECRRRKQKCDQGRPCGNCVKRYPQPPCEYKQNKRRNPAVPREPAFKVVLPAQDYDYAKFSGIPNAIEQQRRHQQQFLQQQQEQWDIFTAAAAAAGNNVLGADPILDRWQGLDLMPTDDYTMTDAPMAEGSDGGGGLPAFFNTGNASAFGGSFPPTGFPIQQYGDGSHEGQGHGRPNSGNAETDNGMFLLNLDHAAIIHHDVLSDAFQLLQARQSISNELLASVSSGRTDSTSAANMDYFYAWLRILTWTAPGHYGHSNNSTSSGSGGRGQSRSRNGSQSSTSSGHSLPGTNLLQITGPAADLAHLPLEATRLNVDLVRIYVKLISRFKSCLDGNPDPTNPYTRIYVPYCLQTPLLAQVAIYTSACFLHETGHLDKMVAVTHKGRAIDMLNAQLQGGSSTSGDGGPASTSTSDDAITAVIQLVMDEWYWGQTQNLHAHLRGLREMIRLRGGLQNLGMNGLVRKLAMASDMAIALSLEMAPVLQGNSHGSSSSNLFDYEDLSPAPFRVSHNTPLVSGQPTFAQCAEPLDIHPTTASILDDMRFLITAVLALPASPTAKELQKVQTTAQWIHDRIQRLPADSPEPPENNNVNSEGNGLLSTETQGMANRRPSIVLSQAEPHQQPNLGFSAQSPSFLDHNVQQQRQSSASPRLMAGHRAQSGSPHLAHLAQPSPTPPGSADGSLLSIQVVDPHEFVQLWTATWRISLTSWKGLLGVFMWVTLSIIASARDTPHDLFVKSMLSICTVQMSLESWDVAAGALKAAVRLNAWLGSGANGSGSRSSGANSGRRRGDQSGQSGQARAAGHDVSGVAGFSSTMEHHGLRDGGATLPAWNP